MNNKKVLIIVRGLPGSGKTTFGEYLAGLIGPTHQVFSADDFFTTATGYNFDPSKLAEAHAYCKNIVGKSMRFNVSPVIVANTFTTDEEMKSYFELANIFGYSVFSLIVENRHGNGSIHNVPEETIEKMRKRFDVKL